MSKKDFSAQLTKRAKPNKEYNHFKLFDSPKSSTNKEDDIDVVDKKKKDVTKKENPRQKNKIIREQKGNKKETKGKQIENSKGTIREQIENNKGTIRKQKENEKRTTGEQIENNKGTAGEQIREQIPQTVAISKDTASLENEVISLSAQQKKILVLIVEKCISNGGLFTGPIQTKDIGQVCNTTIDSVKTQIKRLVKKGLIYRGAGKRAQGGFINLGITDQLKQVILDINSKIKNQPNFNILNPMLNIDLEKNKGTNKGTSDHVVSSSNINTNTTLPEEWVDLDIECLKDHGLQENHIIQIDRAYKKNPDIALSLKAVQDSIYAMAYDLKCNADRLKIKTSPIAMLTSVLKRGEPYSSVTPENYMTPRELAMQKYREHQKLREDKLKQIEEDIFNSELEDWLNALDNSDRVKILSDADIPNNLRPNMKKRLESGHLKTHFEENVWPEIKQSVMSGNRETVV